MTHGDTVLRCHQHKSLNCKWRFLESSAHDLPFVWWDQWDHSFGIWNYLECNQWKNSPPVSFISFISDFLDGIYAPQSGDLKIASPENVSVGDYGISLYPYAHMFSVAYYNVPNCSPVNHKSLWIPYTSPILIIFQIFWMISPCVFMAPPARRGGGSAEDTSFDDPWCPLVI